MTGSRDQCGVMMRCAVLFVLCVWGGIVELAQRLQS